MIDALVSRLKGNTVAAAVNSRLKSWMVERDAARTQARYLREAQRRRIAAPSGADLQQAIRARIAARISRRGLPKPPGQLHIFLAYSLCNWESILPAAMARFGEVTPYEWHSRAFDQRQVDWLQRRDDMNGDMLAAFQAANRRRPVDLVVGYLSGFTVSPEILRQMAAEGAIVANFCFDDKIAWPGSVRGGRYTSTAAIAHAVDINLTNDPHAGIRYLAHGGLAMFHPEAADPQQYRPLDLPFEFPVSFVGACYGWRPRLIEGLRQRGLDVACFGKGWPRGPISSELMNEIYARSRVNLGCGGIGYSKKLLCLKGRDFEVPMSGAVYLTQANPELSLVFDVGRDILTYRSVDECAGIIRELLNDEARAAKIRAAARARCLADHTYEARWARALVAMGVLSGV